MKLSAILGPLLDAKADHELIRKMVIAHEQAQADALERRRESDRIRQAAKAERDRASRDSRERYDAASSRGRNARVEDKTSNSEIEPQEKKETPLSRLRAVLDEDHARAVVEHRRGLRKQLTERAAKMLAAELAKFPDPNAAADRMILKGWHSIDVAWPEAWPEGSRARAGPVTKSRGVGGVFSDLVGHLENGERQDLGGEATGSVVLSLPHRRTG